MRTFLPTLVAILVGAAIISGFAWAKSRLGKKTFFSIVATIVVVGVVTCVFVWVNLRLDEWERAQDERLAEHSSLAEQVEEIARQPIVTYDDKKGVLTRLTKIQFEQTRLKQEIVELLRHKPFGLPLTESQRDFLDSLTKSEEDQGEEQESQSVRTDEGDKPKRLAPEGIVYNVVRLSTRLKHGLAGIEPGTELKVISKNSDGSLHIQAGDLVADAPLSAVTNDLDVAAAVVEQERKKYMPTATPENFLSP